jgi:hypothetical protein
MLPLPLSTDTLKYSRLRRLIKCCLRASRQIMFERQESGCYLLSCISTISATEAIDLLSIATIRPCLDSPRVKTATVVLAPNTLISAFILSVTFSNVDSETASLITVQFSTGLWTSSLVKCSRAAKGRCPKTEHMLRHLPVWECF